MARGDPGEGGYTPEVMPEDFPRKLTPRMEPQEAGLAGHALESVADSMDQKYKADSATWAGEQISNFRVQALQTFDNMKGQVQGDPTDFTSKYLAAFDKQSQPLMDSGNPIAHAMLQKGVGELRNTLAEHSMGWEATQRVAYRTDAIDTGLKSQLPIVESHPELADQVGSTLMDQINATGGDPTTRLKLARGMHEQLSEAASYGLARQNPRGVLDALNHPDSAPSQIQGLNVEQIERVRARANEHLSDPIYSALSQGDIKGAQDQLNRNADLMDPRTYESAQRGILATQEHQLVTQEKNQKVASDNLSKEGDSLLANGQLDAKWIEAHRQTLEPNEFRYFYKALSGSDESATNPRVFADLYLKAAQGQDVRDDARDALVDAHTLSRQDFTKIAGVVDQERPGWFKRGTQSIAGALDPGQLNPDPDTHHSRSLALQDWEDWSQKHPEATDKEAEGMANTISDHYRIVPAATTVLSMKAPLYLTGTRAQPVDEQGKPDPMLNATARKTMAALKAGEITQDEAREQALLIQQYRSIAQAQAQAAAAAAKKKASQ
jgi:hypothetical protein